MTTVKKQIENALMWIEGLGLTEYTQAEGKMGSVEDGFCCLGLGSHLCGEEFDPELDVPETHEMFGEKVGLWDKSGEFIGINDLEEDAYVKLDDWLGYEHNCSLMSLYEFNDGTMMGFEGIQELLMRFPEAYFIEEVAKGIHKVYDALLPPLEVPE